ncbi:hypothetical protein EV44_g3633 [Erysiphe necator]|uniref:Integrase catalytic domain-containing protein n=1 Tax=Uncinula necator TaxID=52586 RepID=A0A0B1P0Q1_UNCNE|nr:hypothetical protein EV44_g3633 [Erysiphe necator]
MAPKLTSSFIVSDRYGHSKFHGVMIDTGAAGKSTAGYNQYLAYCRLFSSIPINESEKGAVNATFGIGSTTSIGSIIIGTPIGECEFHILKTNTPFLLSLNDMDKRGIILDNLRNILVTNNGGSIPIVRKFGHPFMMWGTMVTSTCYLTETELRTLHRRFGHPSAIKLLNLLEKAGHNDRTHRRLLEAINNNCAKCRKYTGAPMRFKFTLRDDVDFNHSIFIDVMYIDGSPVLHVVDEATRFQAAKWLKNMSSQHIWEALRMCWIDVYLGPRDIINHDAGTNFTSHEFLQNAQALAIETKTAPVESANSMGIVERYHKPLRRAYEIIKEDLGTNNSLEQKAMVLQMATKAINDTAGYDGIVPTLLVFGAFPRISNIDPPAPSIAKRAAAIRKAMLVVSKLRAKRQVTDALRTRNGPVTSDIPIGSDVLIWRVHENSWNGPYKILAINGETATVQMPHGPANFRSTNIKLYNHPTNANNELEIENTSSPINADNSRRRQPVRNAGLPTRYQDSKYLNEESKPNFSVSRRKELDGLLERGVFEFINVNDIPTGARIFKSRFVDQIKNAGTANAFEKSRLC